MNIKHIRKAMNYLIDEIEKASNEIIESLTADGYNIINVDSGVGYIQYNNSRYGYMAKSCSYATNPTGLNLLLNKDKVLDSIKACIPNKEDYLLVMYLPVRLECGAPTVRFAADFDVIKI